MVFCLAKVLTKTGSARQCQMTNELNLRSILGSHTINDEVGCYSFAGAVVPYQFPFLQTGLFLLVLLGMEVVLSVWMVRRLKKAIPG